MSTTLGYFQTWVKWERHRWSTLPATCGPSYLNSEMENGTEIMCSDHSIVRGKKKSLKHWAYLPFRQTPRFSCSIQRSGVLTSSCHPMRSDPLFSICNYHIPGGKWPLAYVPVRVRSILKVQSVGISFPSSLKSCLLWSVTSNSFSFAVFSLIWISRPAGTAVFQRGCLFKRVLKTQNVQPWAFLDVTLPWFLRPSFLLDDFRRIAFLSRARMKDENYTQSFSKLLSYTSGVQAFDKTFILCDCTRKLYSAYTNTALFILLCLFWCWLLLIRNCVWAGTELNV